MLNFKNKILSPKALQVKLKKIRKGKDVVFTNGCFDILHDGHVTYLEQARNLGDILIVAMDTDAAVKKQKGPTRPVNALASRQKVMAALESVSFITYFGSGDPRDLIKVLKPDILVKGGDWTIDKIVGAKEVLQSGGKVFSLPYLKGRSTTNIVNKIKTSKK